MRKLISVFFVLAFFSGCAHRETVNQKEAASHTSIEAKQLAAEEEASLVTELSFAKERFAISQKEEERLKKLLTQAKFRGQIDDIKVISWADAEYPSVHTKKLSDSQRQLAQSRAEQVKKIVKDWDSSVSVSTFNMAERPGILADLFQSPSARIKKSLEIAGIPNTDTTVKVPPKASKAIVMVILKE